MAHSTCRVYDRLYMERKNGGQGLISMKQSVRSEEARLREWSVVVRNGC